MKTSKKLRAFFHQQRKAFLQLENRVHSKPSKTTVHNLRVSARKLRTLQELFDLPQLGELKRVVKVSGKLRDLDVGLDHASEFSLPTKEIVEKRLCEKRKLMAQTRKRKRRAARQELIKAEKALEIRLKSFIDYNVFLAELRWLLEQSLTPQNGHKVRIEIKRARYLLESLGLPVGHLIQLQDTLGEWHDLVVLEQKHGNSRAARARQQLLLEGAMALRPLVLRELSVPFPSENSPH